MLVSVPLGRVIYVITMLHMSAFVSYNFRYVIGKSSNEEVNLICMSASIWKIEEKNMNTFFLGSVNHESLCTNYVFFFKWYACFEIRNLMFFDQ